MALPYHLQFFQFSLKVSCELLFEGIIVIDVIVAVAIDVTEVRPSYQTRLIIF